MDDFPTEFENAQSYQQQVNCDVVDGLDSNSGDDNTVLIPLVLVGMNKVDGDTICYYRNRYESEAGKSLIHAEIEAAIKLTDGQTDAPDNPYMKLSFLVNQSDAEGRTDHFSSNREPSAFVVTHKNENANGGRDIPVDQMKRPMVPGDELHSPNNNTLARV